MEILNILKFQQSDLPVTYLGLPLSNNQIKERDCAKLYQTIQNKINNWSSKMLSTAGRVELVHTVITAVIMYWLQSHNIPAKTLEKIEKLCANFIWNGKSHKISWNTITKTKETGGLGIRKFSDINEACKFKLF